MSPVAPGGITSAAPSSRAQPAAAPGAATTTVLSSSARGSVAPSGQTRTSGPPAGADPSGANSTIRWPCVQAPPSAAATRRAMPALARVSSSRQTSARHGTRPRGTGTP